MERRTQGARLAALALCGALAAWGLGPAPANASQLGGNAGASGGAGLSTASLNGIYATVGLGDGGTAAVIAIGSLVFDGQGSFAGQFLQSEPTSSPACGERPTLSPNVGGTYYVEPNGTGAGVITITSTSSSVTTNFALVVTESIGQSGIRQGKAVSLILEAPDPIAGGITRLTCTRRPLLEGGVFDPIDGSFATTCIGLGGQVSEGGVGLLEFNGGNGTTLESTTANVPGATFDQRQLVFSQRQGTFTFDPTTGIGLIVRPGATNARFLVTRARMAGGQPIATEIFVTESQVDPSTGNVVVQTARRLD